MHVGFANLYDIINFRAPNWIKINNVRGACSFPMKKTVDVYVMKKFSKILNSVITEVE